MFHILQFVCLNLFPHFNYLKWVRANLISWILEYQDRLVGFLNIASRLSNRSILSSTLDSLGIFLIDGGLAQIRTWVCVMSYWNPLQHRAVLLLTGYHQVLRWWRYISKKYVRFLILEHFRWNQAVSPCNTLWARNYQWFCFIDDIFL